MNGYVCTLCYDRNNTLKNRYKWESLNKQLIAIDNVLYDQYN